jgi:3-oxoacyl-[acyl-carrier protein] reductase
MTMKRALVTGGSGAIGAAICRTLAGRGFHVVVHGFTHGERADALAAEIVAGGGSAEAIGFDLRDGDAVVEKMETLLRTGPIQVLVHNAGIFHDGPMAGMSRDKWLSVIDTSLNGFYYVTQPLLLPMLRTRWGRIVAMSSISAIHGNRGQANYAAAKAGLHGAAKSLARECASRGVTVNVVAPGIIDTPEVATLFSKERVAELVPMQRMGQPDEVAKLVAYLVSDDAAYVTGQVISISGGVA